MKSLINSAYKLTAVSGILAVAFFAFAGNAFAANAGDVVINEFSSDSSPEWVELRNTTASPIDLTGWKFTDLTSPATAPVEADLLALSGTIPAGGVLAFNVGTTELNNPGDSIGVYDNSGTPVLIDRVTYGTVASVDYPTTTGLETEPGATETAFRDSVGAWHIVTFNTKDSANVEITNGSTYYPTIQAAIDVADPDDTINIGAGKYSNVQLIGSYAPNISLVGDSADTTTIEGLDLTGATFNGLTFKNFTLTGDSTRGRASVEVESPGTYSNLTFESNIFDGESVAGRRAIFSNLGFDGFTLKNNEFKNYTDTTSTAYSVVFMEAQDSTWGGNYIAIGNSLDNSDFPNFLEAYRWKNVTFTDNDVNANSGRLLVWSDTQRGALESLGTINMSNNHIAVQSGKGIGVYTATSTTANILDNTISGADVCVVLDSVSNSSVTGNTLSNCDTGVLFQHGVTVPVTTVITGNSISGNTVALQNDVASYSIDATNNWWGTSVLADIQAKVVGKVNFNPYYINSRMTETNADLETAKTNAHDALTTALAGYTVGNYTGANWIVLNRFKTDGDTAIDAATDSASVTSAQNTATSGMAEVEKIQETRRNGSSHVRNINAASPTLPSQASPVAVGRVLGAETVSPEIVAQIQTLKAQIAVLIRELIMLLQAEMLTLK